MAELDIELDDKQIDGIKRLAVRCYGNSEDASIGRVVEAAFGMRLLWEDLTKGGGNEIEEPLVNWEFTNRQQAEQLPDEIRDWLFRR